MSGLKELMRKLMGAGSARAPKHDRTSGDEGRAFQVNSDPEPVTDVGDDRESGAQGHAFQVNGDPEHDDDATPKDSQE